MNLVVLKNISGSFSRNALSIHNFCSQSQSCEIVPLMPSRLIEYVVSDQKRGDVVSNGDHCGIAVSATESIAAGKEKASQFPPSLCLELFCWSKSSLLFSGVQGYNGQGYHTHHHPEICRLAATRTAHGHVCYIIPILVWEIFPSLVWHNILRTDSLVVSR
jgi:hypothetical protein